MDKIFVSMSEYPKWIKWQEDAWNEYERKQRRKTNFLIVIFFAIYAFDLFAFCKLAMDGEWGRAFFYLFMSLCFAGFGTFSLIKLK